MEITKIKGAEVDHVQIEVAAKLHGLGYETSVLPRTSTSFEVRDIRLSPERIQERGYNYNMSNFEAGITPHPRRTHALSWDNWVEVNNAVNEVLDKMGVSANVRTLKGKFKIREGTQDYTEEDWEDLSYENVGSQMSPIQLRDKILSESELKNREITPARPRGAWSQHIKLPSQNPSGWHNEPINHALASKGIKVGKSRTKR
jgi:hypothetical protein